MRRDVAQWLLAEAAEARRPAAAFKPLVRAADAAGRDDLYEKSLAIGAMCSYFADRMWQREGLRYLLPLKQEVAAEYVRTGDPMWAGDLRTLDRVEQRLRARRRPW